MGPRRAAMSFPYALEQAEPHCEQIRMGKKGTTQLNRQQKLQISTRLVLLLTVFCSHVEHC